MERKRKAVEPKYIVDESGKRVSVILPMEEYDMLLEDVDDLAAVAERREEKSVSHLEVIERLKADGLL